MSKMWKSRLENIMQKHGNCRCLSVSLLMAALCGIFAVFQPLYLNVDNYQTALVLNRVYDADNYCMFVNPLLCLLSGLLGDVMPSADNYTLLSRVLILLGVWCLGYHIAKASRKKLELFCGYLMLFLLVVNASLFFDYFTIWASFFTCTGMVSLILAVQQESRKQAAAGTVFLICGVMWRMESAAIFLPFFVLELFTDLVFRTVTGEKKRQWIKKTCRLLLPAVLCTVLLLLTDLGFKASDRYKAGVEYSNAVSSVVDFPMEHYEDVADRLPGISKNDYESLRLHMYADTDRIDAAYARKISEGGSKKAGISDLWSANKQLLETIITSKKTLFSIVLLFLLLLWLVLSNTMWYNKLELLLAYSGAWLIILYFTWIGRAPLRIVNSVLYAVFGIVLILYRKGSMTEGRAGAKWVRRFIGLAVFSVVCVDTISYDFISPQSVLRVREDEDESRWQSTYADGELYLWKTSEYVLYPMADYINQGKFMTDEFLAHNLSYGDWVYGQVYYERYLERLGIPNPVKALIERDRMYYVALDETEMLRYLQEHYDKTIQARKVRELEGIPVWEFQSAEEIGKHKTDITE